MRNDAAANLLSFLEGTLSSLAYAVSKKDVDLDRRLDIARYLVNDIDLFFEHFEPRLATPTPIEDKFAQAVFGCCTFSVGWHSWSDALEAIEWAQKSRSSVMFGVAHQVLVPRSCGRHFRVDFLFAAPNFTGGPAHLVAVECDGHEFHEKTKEQAASDKSRDRELAAAGVTVLRFTGSEIWRDAEKCANEVEALLWTRCYGTISRPTHEGEAADA